jgi:hypothetical protein
MAEASQQMRLAGSWWAEGQQVVPLADPAVGLGQRSQTLGNVRFSERSTPCVE